jgi:hypothetical protein
MRQAHYTPKEALIHLALEPENDTPRAWYRKYAALWAAGLTPIRRGKRVKLLRSEVEALKADLDQGRAVMTASGKVKTLKGVLVALALLVFTSCASLEFSQVKGHYALHGTAHGTEPTNITVGINERVATITTTDVLGQERTVRYQITGDGWLIPISQDAPRAYTVDIHKGRIILTDIDGNRFRYDRTTVNF